MDHDVIATGVTMRELILSEIKDRLLNSRGLADFFRDYRGDPGDFWDRAMDHLTERATDSQLLTIFHRLLLGDALVVHGVWNGIVDVTLDGRIVGGIDSDGNIHT
jgi:hypothetical protein